MTESTKSILIVDDTPENITALSAVVSDFGKIKAATSGERALKICDGDAKPDLILLDVLMPGMDGWEVCRRLKEDPATASIPVVYVTALASDADRERASGLGAAGFITKPLDPQAIRALVGSLLK
jgi:putative two-component system response regulator